MLKPSFLSDEYLVSDEGYVLGKNGTTHLKPSKNWRGYLIVNLMIDGKRKGIAIHTLVARAFCDGYKEGLTVNHKDGNKENNNASNLEWVTSKENTLHSIYVLGKNTIGKNNPNAKKIRMIKDDIIINEFDSCIDAAKFFEPNSEYKRLRHIQNCICRSAKLNKTYRKYIWEYV